MRRGATLLAVVVCVLGVKPAFSQISVELLGTYSTGQYGEAAAEICAYDPATQRVFVTNDGNQAIDILDISNPLSPQLVGSVDVTPYGDAPTSVAVKDGLGAAAIKSDPVTDPGVVLFFDCDGTVLGDPITVGSLPDSIVFTPDGKKVLVPNEGEPNDDYTVDPEGTVSIIDVSGPEYVVQTVEFSAFNRFKRLLQIRGIRIYGPKVTEVDGELQVEPGGASVAQDLEPEYIAVSEDSKTAWVALQENNAVAVVDICRAKVKAILPLGAKWHFLRKNGLDPSNRDDGINIAPWPVLGMYQPDAMKAFRVRGKTYLITANEGDSRDYDGFSEEARVKDLTLGGILAKIPELQEQENLGRLKTTTSPPRGLREGAGPEGEDVFRLIYSYGARSFSIWDARTMRLVYDSGDDFEQITAERLGEDFNSNNDGSPSGDARSDDKGPEPEAVVLGQVGDQILAFVGLERPGGIMIYNVSNPRHPSFVDYVNNRDFTVEFDLGDCEDCGDDCSDDLTEDCVACRAACEACEACGADPEDEDCLAACQECASCEPVFVDCVECTPEDPALAALIAECTAECEEESCPQAGVEGRDPGDLAPEGLFFIPPVDSPTGWPLLVVANEVSGTTSIFEIRP